MKEVMVESAFFGVVLSLLAFYVGCWAKKKLKKEFVNPLLISVVLVIGVLVLFNISYESYETSAKYLSYLLTPTTVCLAVPLYEQLSQLKQHWKAIFAGIFAGALTSLASVLAMSVLFGLTHQQYVTLLPKSVTTAIGIGVVEELGGVVSITATVIVITGVLGNIIGESVLRRFHITEPVAKGVALGTSAHAVGTAKAIEMGEVEGAMSGLSIAVSGLLTAIGASMFAMFW